MRVLLTSAKQQLIISKLCIYLDNALSRERVAMRMQLTPLVKNLLRYIFHSHLVLCMTVYVRLPENLKSTNKWAMFLEEIIEIKFRKKMLEQIQ